jgi:hypothetical protein
MGRRLRQLRAAALFCFLLAVLAGAGHCQNPPPQGNPTSVKRVVARAGVPPAAVPPEGSTVDHFKFWKVEPVPFQRQVKLKGQFDKAAWPAQIDSVQYLGNPVRKNNEPIHDPKTHLVAYFLHQSGRPGPRRWVRFSNQFAARALWRLTDPAMLLVPAGKTFPQMPPSPPTGTLDHFVCYRVLQTTPVIRPVTLLDQFDQKRDKAESIRQLQPVYFCVPVEKNGEPITNKRVHLAIYNIAPRASFQPPITVWTRDQLRRSILKVTESVMLAVPSQKTGWGRDRAGTTPGSRSVRRRRGRRGGGAVR